MIEIKLEEASSLTLEMKIDGDTRNVKPELRFSILSEGMRYSFPSHQTSEDVYRIDFPVLEGKLTEGQYDAVVEIMIDGKYFVPLQETVRVTKEIKPTVKLNSPVSVQETVRVKIGSVEKTVAKTQIGDIRALVAALVENGEIDTDLGLKCLNGFASNKSLITESFKIAPKKPLLETEAVAVLRMIREHGTDLEGQDSASWRAIKNMSPKVEDELKMLLADKGMSARVLKQHGF